jgi:Sigma-54 interaction domain/Bacterial regulatory protein, Fis family
MSNSSARLFTADDRAFLHAVVGAGHANPFAPARVEAERAALGPLFVEPGESTSPRGDPPAPHPNLQRIAARLGPILAGARARLTAGAAADRDDRVLYQEACLYLLHDAHDDRLQPLVEHPASGAAAGLYRAFLEDHGRLLAFPRSPLRPPRPEHVFACAFQLRRAFHHLSCTLIGTSRPAADLRAALWNAIFTRDLGGYLRSCETRQSDVSTLVTGPSGTGKELVAQAIGRSRYVDFDREQGKFVADPSADFRAIDLSALPDTLFESALFGHERGAFTGAMKEKKGLFEAVRAGGAVFLDEIGELGLDRQVKLLRVLEARAFHRVGDTEEHQFSARVVSATHRDMSERVRTGAFRLDLYQRLAGLRIVTPSLREQLDAAPEDLTLLVRVFARRVVGEEGEEALAVDALRYIEEHLPDYAWPGNARELGHCVESIHHAGEFTPLDLGDAADGDPARSLREGTLSEVEAIRRYRNIVFARTGSVTKAARRLGIHRNTVTKALDRARIARWRGARGR